MNTSPKLAPNRGRRGPRYAAMSLLLPGILFAQEAATTTEMLNPLTVTGTLDDIVPYSAPVETFGGLKANIPLLETPQAISVVEQELIQDQGARKLEEVLRNVAGITPGGYYSEWDYYRIRGFDSSFNTFIDGLRGDYGTNQELFGLERVEVIKGPASSLYGQAPLGGIVNLVSKKPQHHQFGEVTATYGTWDFREATLDYNMPLLTPGTAVAPDGKTVLAPENDLGVYFRLNALTRNKESFVDFYKYDRLYVAPSLRFEWGDHTDFTLLTNFMRDDGQFAMPLPARGTVLPNPHGEIPISRFVGLPGRTGAVDLDRLNLGYQFRHEFNELLTFRQNFNYGRLEQNWQAPLYPSFLDADQRTLWGYPYGLVDGRVDRYGVDSALDFDFETGFIGHKVTFGQDYYSTKDVGGNQQIDYGNFPGSYVALDLFNPNYNVALPGFSTFGLTSNYKESLGFYLQDHAKIGDKLTLTVGGRYDNFWSQDSGAKEIYDNAFVPKAGATYELVPGLAAYTNWSKSFTPQWGYLDANGGNVAPEEGENVEGGVKFDLFNRRVTGLASIFHLTRQNVATPNIATADPFDSIVSGEQRSQGFEFETAAELAPGLSLTGTYTYIDAEVTRDNAIPVGTPLIGVAENAFSTWLKYTFQEGPLKGFGAGLGGRYYTEQSGDTYNTFELPAYGLVDAGLFYEKGRFHAQVNFNNVLDKRHFVGSYNDVYVLPGEPFNMSATVGWTF